VALLGIGQKLRGDDGAGPAVARGLTAALAAFPHLLVLDAGPAPESLTGTLRRFQPEVVLLVDAAHLGAPAGTVRWLTADQARGLTASSHTMPPTLLAEYLAAELGCAVALLGIQPQDMLFGAPLSPPVRRSVARIVRELARLLAPSSS
jgi:hydrogenase 3 maturation protease